MVAQYGTVATSIVNVSHLKMKGRRNEMTPGLPCQECGCIGNRSCGCEPVSEVWQCTLNEWLICRCCIDLGKEKNMARWPENNIKPDSIQINLDL